MKKLLVIALLLWAVDASAQLREDPVASLPTEPVDGTTRVVIDGVDEADCATGGGNKKVLCTYRDGVWVAGGGGGGAPPIPSTKLPEDTVFTSESEPVKICGLAALADDCYYFYIHSNGTPTIVPVHNGVENDLDVHVVIGQNHIRCFDDYQGNSMLCFEPATGRITFGANYQQRKVIWIPAGNLIGDGTNCPERASAVTINSGPKIDTFVCLDNNGSRLNGTVGMRKAWNAGTIKLTLVGIQTAANTAALAGHFACQARGAGEAPSSTWGSEVAITDAGVNGSNQWDYNESGDITCAGTPAARDILSFYYDVDATGTVTTAASYHYAGVWLEYGLTRVGE